MSPAVEDCALKLDFSDGLDELAATSHAGFLPRLGATLAVAVILSLLLPLNICIGWGAVATASEVSAWFGTRQQFRGEPISWKTRLWHVIGLAVSSVAWVYIGAVLWLTGSPEPALCGVVIWLAIIFFSQTNAYQSPVGFAISGALPGVAMMAFVVFTPNPLHQPILPLALILVLALCFAAEGVLRMIRARQHLTDAQTEIRKSAVLWRMLFDQSPLPQMFFDASALYELIYGPTPGGRPSDALQSRAPSVDDLFGRIKLNGANTAAERLFGVNGFPSGLTGGYFEASFLQGLGASLNAAGPDGMLAPFETTIHNAEGLAVDVRVHIRAVPDTDRPWANGIATFVDVTEARLAAAAQADALQAAEAANRAKSDFLATMSHEIRTPLNGVLGMAQAMAADTLPETQRERLAVVRRSGETLLTILNDILDLSKIEAGKLELEEVDFDIAEVASATVAAFGAVASSKGVDLQLRIGVAAEGVYRSDPTRVRQILNNLISNALKFTEQGQVRVAVERAGDMLEMRVSDTGVGIPADRLDALFQKFTQADASTTRKYGGTGLGLAICRELAEIIGGDIRAESTIGEGTTFIVRLLIPRVGDAMAFESEETAPRDWDAANLRILAAEDNSVNQLVLKTLLSQVGIDPMVVGDGAEALEAWRDHDWDLILMDVQMPIMDGPTATRAIREAERIRGRARTPIVALTANAMAHQIAEYRAAGMDGFVAKPIDVEKLFAAIEAALDQDGDAEAVA
jgi:signal transduction histidine kinase/ActR/RegA family two-component response regulator